MLMLLYDWFQVLSVMNRVHSQTVLWMICSQHLSTLALVVIMVGMFQRYFSVDTRLRLDNGNLIKQWNALNDYALTS